LDQAVEATAYYVFVEVLAKLMLSTRFRPDTRLVGHGLRPPSTGEIGEDPGVAC
jgi:hypothetical protein